MSPILGIYASQMSGHLWPASSYESIATVTVGSGGASTITFSSIPSTYTHLQIRTFSRSDYATTQALIKMQFNGDTGTNYSRHLLSGNGSTVSSTANASASFIVAGQVSGTTANANVFGIGISDILDYKDTNKNKTVRTLRAVENNSDTNLGLLVFSSGLWLNTNAITSIVMIPNNGNFIQYSSFALYGIKVAA